MEASIASNATLQGSFDQIERLAYRLLDWGDFRIYRVRRRRPSLAYRGTLGRARPRASRLRASGPVPKRGGRPRVARSWCKDVRRDRAVRTPIPGVGSLVDPSDPFRRRAARHGRGGPSQAEHLRRQGPRRAEHAGEPDGHGDPHRRAAAPAAQHRRPDRPTGDRAGPASPSRCARRPSRSPTASQGMRQGATELESFVTGGSAPPTSLSEASRARWPPRVPRPPPASGTAADVAGRNRVVIGRGDRPAGRTQGVRLRQRRPGGDARRASRRGSRASSAPSVRSPISPI